MVASPDCAGIVISHPNTGAAVETIPLTDPRCAPLPHSHPSLCTPAASPCPPRRRAHGTPCRVSISGSQLTFTPDGEDERHAVFLRKHCPEHASDVVHRGHFLAYTF